MHNHKSTYAYIVSYALFYVYIYFQNVYQIFI